MRNRLKETFLWEKKLQKKLCFTGALEYSPAKTSFSIGFTLFTHNFFQLTKKSYMKSVIPGESFGEICFLELHIFFSSRPKKEKKNPSWFHTSRKKFLLRKKYLKNPFCVLNQVTRLKKKCECNFGKNVSAIFLNSWGVSWNFFFTRRKKKLKEKKKKNTPGKIIPWFHTK